ncbi:Ras-related small GTP-binding family protein [Hibiscus syriacus]|uniref:Ras-related small GTP-binding family protein n=1 Tax=Hibiscus syriacus TaxID=106335 RepID=A0A6A2XVH3_HIBSY|nr:uncharacterized protein LOC120192357 [Hibiscus syriacus]KAE8658134.1 Ras-related small GTP-binding family protein [Hibiscus syriacus]
MKGASKVIMGATLVMVVTLAVVLALILVLLAELYCSLLLRRRRSRSQLKHTTADTTTAPTTPTITESTTSPLSSFYAQGVLHAPMDFLFPATAARPENVQKDNKITSLHHVIELHGGESNTRPHRIGILSPTSPSSSFAASPNNAEEISVQACSGNSGPGVEDLVYISNPMYVNDVAPDTPFETPDTSPSRLENGGSSGDEEKGCFGIYSPPPITPPLSPMKKLPAQACSIPLRDVGSLATSASESNCNNGLSSSSSGSPCTSPSW